MLSKIIHFIPCLISYRQGLTAVYRTGSPYRSGSPEDQAWNRGWEAGQAHRNNYVKGA